MPLEKKLLVIIGITGAQGGSVAKVFLEDHPDWRIRGITRDPSKPSSAHLLKAGVELVAADLNNVASLQSAFRDADAIFAVTDFWQFLLPGSSVNVQIEAERRGCPVNELALEKEYANGKK